MNIDNMSRVAVAAWCVLSFGLTPVLSVAADTSGAQVEEIEVNPVSSENQAGVDTEESTKEKAASLWKQTKQKSGEAATSAAEYSKVQSTRLLEASKTGLAKGADAVSKGTTKAWSATKDATRTAVDYTAKKASEAGEAISDVLTKENPPAPVSEKSIDSQ